MKLHILAGRVGPEKGERMAACISEARKHNVQHILLLVPEQSTLQAEQELIRTLQLPGMMDVQVMSPSRLAKDVFDRVGGRRGAVVDARGRSMVLRRVVEEHREELGLFGKVATLPGFSVELADFFSNLKRFDVTPDALRTAAAQADSPLLSAKLGDLVVLYEGFSSYMADKQFLDAEDEINALIDALQHADYLTGGKVFVDRFDYLPPQSVRMLSALLRLSSEVTVTLDLPGSPSRDTDLFAAGVYNRAALVELAERMGAEVEEEWVNEDVVQHPRAPELAYLEREFFAYPPTPYQGPDTGAVTLMQADTPEDEVEGAAAHVAKLIQDQGCRYRDIAVVCGSLSAYSSRIERVFGRHGIPVFLDERRTVLQHPVVEYLLCALRIMERNAKAEDVLRLIKTGLAGVSQNESEWMEIYIRQYGIRGVRALQRPWEKPMKGMPDLNINAARERMAAPLPLGMHGKQPARVWAEALFAMLEKAGIPDRLDEEQRELESQGWLDAAAETAQVWNTVIETLDQVAAMLEQVAMDAGELADLLESGFAAAEVGVLPTGVDQVLVGDMGRTKAAGLRHLIVMGANDGSIPVQYPEGSILHERDIAMLQDMHVPVGRDGGMRIAQSMFGVYMAFAKPSEGLLVSWSSGNGEGGALEPSHLIHRLRRLLPVREVKPPPWPITTAKALLRPLAGALRVTAGGREAIGPWRPVLRTLLNQVETAPRVKAMLSGLNPGTAMLREPHALAQQAERTSISRLEQYNRCPFAWFVQYGLQPVPWQEFGMDLAQAGSFLHEAVADFGRKMSALDTTALDEAAALGMMDAVVDDISRQAAEGALQADARGRWLEQRLRQVCRRAAETYLRQVKQGGFVPRDFEVAFGPGTEYGDIRLPLENGRCASLSGRVDRVDVYSTEACDYLRVIDYKSGTKAMDLAGAMGGWQVQLWVYMAALCDGWKSITGREARPAGLMYFPVADNFADGEDDPETARTMANRLSGICVEDEAVLAAMDHACQNSGESTVVCMKKAKGSLSGNVRPVQEVEAIRQGVMDKIRQTLDAITQGEIRPLPLQEGQLLTCDSCDYHAACGHGMIGSQAVRRPPSKKAVLEWMKAHGSGGAADE